MLKKLRGHGFMPQRHVRGGGDLQSCWEGWTLLHPPSTVVRSGCGVEVVNVGSILLVNPLTQTFFALGTPGQDLDLPTTTAYTTDSIHNKDLLCAAAKESLLETTGIDLKNFMEPLYEFEGFEGRSRSDEEDEGRVLIRKVVFVYLNFGGEDEKKTLAGSWIPLDQVAMLSSESVVNSWALREVLQRFSHS